ncbi:MAG TPA: RtcB family protein [Candidatus Dependentiae bacterium]|nr:RtcB family protein [Candidatus Dependentiae bacterium]HRQ62737.1 RtcB family protein [Candidatus Dependentiae bacterium]
MAEQLITRDDLVQIDEYTYEVPKTYRQDMQVPARVFMSKNMIEDVLSDRAIWQLVNVATLPGIQKYACAMPDIHQGYGFPIGGVAACAIAEGGVISPGGIGYDINCGVRLLVANMNVDEVRPYLEKLATRLFHKVPSGVGRGGKLDFDPNELDKILAYGAERMLQLGYGTQADLEFCEERGRMAVADPDMVSERAKKRGRDQIGTLGSGNHFLEVQYVEEIFDQPAATAYGLHKGNVTVMIHCGSRGLGHQTCTDYVRIMMGKLPEWGYVLPDRELVYAPFDSKEAQDYFAAMAAASNYAWANRHMIGHWVREAWQEVIGKHVELNTVYDVSHNIGKVETHNVDGIEKKLIIHRKGATRAFGPERPENPAKYMSVGQPVLIPGTMGTASYVLAGTQESMDVAFGSSCHGAGRRMSRAQAKKTVRGSQLREELERQGIIIRSDSDPGLAEEAPTAYKDVEDVVDVVAGAQLARKVARLKPLAVIKGG